MHWRIITIAKPKLGYARDGAELYLGRVKRFARVEWLPLKVGRPEEEAQRILRAAVGGFMIAMDERGEEVSSRRLASKIGEWQLGAAARVSVVIGGANGLHSSVLAQADWVWSLSRLTLQHELALLVTMEQIYRAYTIHNGLPYHRE